MRPAPSPKRPPPTGPRPKRTLTRTGPNPGGRSYLLGDLFETNASGTLTTSYTDGPAGNLASFTGPPTSFSAATFLYYDAHGDLAAEANSSGTLTANHTYDPFGAPNDGVPANTTAHRFVGRWDKQYDTTTGLILMGARPYDPATGRFLAVDPVPGGSLNNYDYAGQDPINGYDLNGTCWTGLCWASHAAHAVGRGLASTKNEIASAAKWARAHPYQAVMFGAGFACVFASGGTATAVCVLGVGLGSAMVDIYHKDKAGQGFDLGGIACALAEAGAKGSAKVLDRVCTSLAGFLGVTNGARRR